MITEPAINKDSFNKDGYLILKNAFSFKEIQELRGEVYKQYEIDKNKGLTFQLPQFKIPAKFAKGDLLSKELLSKVLLDERILNLARKILGNEELVYFGDSSYQIGVGSNGFHRDNIDRVYNSGPDWNGNYTLVRIGLYLQDHKLYSGGLKVRQGSHKSRSGKAVFVGNEAGDLVIWDLKTLHSGNGVRIKLAPDLSVNVAFIERHIPAFLRKEEEQERISLFMTFALQSQHLKRYISEYTLKRQDTIEHAKASIHSAGVLEKAKQLGVNVINPLV